MAEGNSEIFDTLLYELEKVEKLNSKVKTVKSQQESLREEVIDIKDFVGYDGDDIKSNNIIDKNKLPARLNTNERIRYENIGKQFTLGAGKEFQKIKDKIRFSEKMSTAKNTFMKGFEKIQRQVKGVKKGKGLWSKIFKIIALMGILGYIFREKIAKSFPKTTDIFKTIIEKIQTSIGVVLGGMYDFLKKSLSLSFIKVLRHMVNVTIPNSVGNFFNVLLPNVILQTWLQIMTLFSSSAGERLSELTGQELQVIAEETTAQAEKGMEGRMTAQEDSMFLAELRRTNNLLDGANNEIDDSDLQGFIMNSGALAYNQIVQDNSDFANTLQEIAKKTFGDDSLDFRKMIESGQFDITDFIKQAKAIMSKTGVDRETAFVQAMYDVAGKSNELNKENLESKAKALQGLMSDDFISTMGRLITNQENLEQKGRAAYNEKAKKLSEEARSAQQKFEDESKKAPIYNVSFNETFDAAITEKLKVVFESINNFLTGNNGNLISYIQKGMLNLAKFYKGFFDKSVDALFQMIKNTGLVFDGYGDKKTVQNWQKIEGNNNIILNVDLSDSLDNAISVALSNLSTSESSILEEIQNTNAELLTLNSTISKINNLHSASKEYVDKKVQEVSNGVSLQKINGIEKTINNAHERINTLSGTLIANRVIPDNGGGCPLVLVV